MFVIEDKGGAIAIMLASLLFLGTWPAVLTLLERRGRLPQHTYLDYSLTNFLAAILIALTFGQLGESKRDMPSFITQLSQVIHLACDSKCVFLLLFLSVDNGLWWCRTTGLRCCLRWQEAWCSALGTSRRSTLGRTWVSRSPRSSALAWWLSSVGRPVVHSPLYG
jgi:hypothetical protein